MLKGKLITAHPSVSSVMCSLSNVSFTLKCCRRGPANANGQSFAELALESTLRCRHCDSFQPCIAARPCSGNNRKFHILDDQLPNAIILAPLQACCDFATKTVSCV